MLRAAEEALEAGAAGISMGLGYAPGSGMQEVVALAALCAKYGRFLPVDTRMYAASDLFSLTEIFDVAAQTGVQLQISHFVYQYGNGTMDRALALADRARERGVHLYIDSGAYAHWATLIGSAVFDESIAVHNGAVSFRIVACTGEHRGELLDIALYRHMRSHHPRDSVVCFTGRDDEILPPLMKEYCVPSSDTGPYRRGEGHPQTSGSFARYLKMMTGAGVSWAEALRKATALPAEILGLGRKGHICEGYDADIVIFDPNTLTDRAEYLGSGQPDAPPEGIDYVLVNGVAAMDHGTLIHAKAGKAVRFI